jgi:hypothetical protein
MKYNQSLYEIKVANGSIFIDATDVEFKDKLEALRTEYKKAEEYLNGTEPKDDNEGVEIMKKFVYQTIAALEKLFGEGSGEKIFPIKSIGSVISFMEELPRELEQAGVKAQRFVDKRTSPNYRKQMYTPRSKR